MEIEVQWDNPAHFLLDRNKNKDGITVELFAVAEKKAPTWFDGGSQTPVPVTSRMQSPMGFEMLTVPSIPTLLVLQFTVRFKDGAFSETLLFVQQLLAFDGTAADDRKWTPSAWMPVLPEGAAELSAKLPRAFNFTRFGAHPLLASVVHQGDKTTIKIATTFLDVTQLFWKAIEANSNDASGFTAREKEFLLDAYHRWYEGYIQETGSKISVLASTAPAPPLIWFVIVPQKLSYNQEDETIFSQVYYRPSGWMPEGRWSNNVTDIIGANRTQKVLPMLLWCVMSPVKVLEQADYAPNLVPFISDRFKLVLPKPFDPKSKGAQRVLIVAEGLWSPQGMAASVSGAGKPQLVFIPLRHDDQKDTTKTVDTAVQPNLHLRPKTAVNVLWCMNHVSTTTLTLKYDDEFVVAGYSAGGFNMWFAAEKNIDKVKALIAFEPAGILTPANRLKTILDSLLRLKRKVFFVGQYKTKGDMAVIWKDRGKVDGITYMPDPDSKVYDAFFAFKPLTTTNKWIQYAFTGLKKRDDEAQAKNDLNKEPHPEPDISLEERKAINRLGFTSDASFGSKFTGGDWTGIPVFHLFAMCGGQVFTPPTLDSKGIVTADAIYKTFYQECMEALS